MKDLRYRGKFATYNGHMVRVELWQETDAPYDRVGRLEFPAAEPLTIEWEVADKLEPVERSHATLRVISPGDRTYADLWTDTAGIVRMDVYIDGQLHWSGTMDPEQYTEPYERQSGYEVELTFGDFGVLDRKKYIEHGVKSVGWIIDEAIRQSEIRSGGASWDKCSTFAGAATAWMPGQTVKDGCGVSSERWTDSEGEQATWLEVVEETLRGLGLKLRQRGGEVHVYDMHGLAYAANFAGQSREVWWNGARQDMGVDRIYNRVKVTWGTYVRDGNLAEEMPWGDDEPDREAAGVDDRGRVVLTGVERRDETDGAARLYSLPDRMPDGTEDTPEGPGMTLWTKQTGRGVRVTEYDGGSAKVMRAVSQGEGEDKDGIAAEWMTVRIDYENHGETVSGMTLTTMHHGVRPEALAGSFATETDQSLYELEGIDLAPGMLGGAMLEVRMELLLHYNPLPWTGANSIGCTAETQRDREQTWARNVNVVYVPIRLTYTDEETGKTYGWNNKGVIQQPVRAGYSKASMTAGRWEEVEAGDREVRAWLAWYDAGIYDGEVKEREKTPFTGGYAVNRPAVCRHARRLTRALADYEGQPVALPPGRAGRLELAVLAKGWMSARQDELAGSGGPGNFAFRAWTGSIEWGMPAYWILSGMPQVRLVRALGAYDRELDGGDVEYELEINARAAEGIEMQTSCGTADATLTGARGAYVDMATGGPLRSIRRGPNTDAAGMVLCATALSQYADRHTTLRGEAELDAEVWEAYTEENQGDRLFYLSGEVQDVQAWTAEVTLVEFNEDKPINQ